MNNPLYNGMIFSNCNYKENMIIPSFYESIISMNKGKKVKIYLNTENKEISGIIEQIGNDFIVVSDPLNNTYNLIPMKCINYITFEEKINYNQDLLPKV